MNREAIKKFRKALELKNVMRKDNLARLYHNAGVASRHEGDNEAALKYFKKALDLSSKKELTLALLCQIYLEEGRLHEAYRQILSRIKDASKIKSAKLLQTYALIMYHRGRIEIAIEFARRALKINPDYAEAFPILAQSFKTLGQIGKAEWYWRQYLEKRPDSLKARLALIEINLSRGNTKETEEIVEELLSFYIDRNICDVLRSKVAGDRQLAIYKPDMKIIQKAIKNQMREKTEQLVSCGL